MYFDPGEVPADLRDCFEEVEVPCLAPWVRVVERAPMVIDRSARGEALGGFGRTTTSGTMTAPASASTTGWRPSCSCADPQPPIPCTVLDCFAGACSAGVAAVRRDRRFVGVDLNPRYLEMGRRRLVRVLGPLFANLSVEG